MASSISFLYSSCEISPVQGAIHLPKCLFKHGRAFPISQWKTRLHVLSFNVSLIVSIACFAAPLLK